MSESASTSSLGSNSSHSKAPGAQLTHNKLQYSQLSSLMAIDTDQMLNNLEKDQQRKLCMAYSGALGSALTQSIVPPYFNTGTEIVDSVVSNGFFFLVCIYIYVVVLI